MSTLLRADNISLVIENNRILDKVSAFVQQRELLGIIGPNGAGKTSLLRVLANLQDPTEGTIQYEGTDVGKIHAKTLATQIGYLEQGSVAHWPLNVKKVVELGRMPYQGFWRRLQEDDKQAILRAIQKTEIAHLSHRDLNTLSGGERTRVLLARLFATEPIVILADEPTAALDPYHQIHIMELLREHAQKGAVVVVLHDLNYAARFCDRLILMDKGQIVDAGSVKQVLNNDNLGRVYGIEAHIKYEGQTMTVIPRKRIVKSA